MQRLTRLRWVYTEAPVYFITAVTHERRRILTDNETHEVFRWTISDSQNRAIITGLGMRIPMASSAMMRRCSMLDILPWGPWRIFARGELTIDD